MRIFKACSIALCSLVIFAILAPGAKANVWDKKTIVTFSNAVEIPGQVLEPGTYVFKLMGTPFNRNLVQVWSQDERHLLATINAIPASQPQANDKSVFNLRPDSEASSRLHSWFYAGEISGQGFAEPRYPKNEEPASRYGGN